MPSGFSFLAHRLHQLWYPWTFLVLLLSACSRDGSSSSWTFIFSKAIFAFLVSSAIDGGHPLDTDFGCQVGIDILGCYSCCTSLVASCLIRACSSNSSCLVVFCPGVLDFFCIPSYDIHFRCCFHLSDVNHVYNCGYAAAWLI